jgi:hypothetical protein
VALVALLAWTTSSCGAGDGDDEGTDPAPTTAAAPDLSDAALWLSFEEQELTYGGGTEYPDALDGPFAALVVTANDGAVEVVAGADGRGDAVAFPEKCDATAGCPRAMLEVPPDAALDPGTGDFEFGAAVWVAPDQTTTGSNIVQRGRFDTEGGLWKLQVDSIDGRPSCVVRSGDDQVLVRSSVPVADSAWHRVVCRRDATGVEIEVDGEVDREDGETGSVDSEWPIRIGSPGVGDQDDQFHGRIDDVFLRIAPSA